MITQLIQMKLQYSIFMYVLKCLYRVSLKLCVLFRYAYLFNLFDFKFKFAVYCSVWTKYVSFVKCYLIVAAFVVSLF